MVGVTKSIIVQSLVSILLCAFNRQAVFVAGFQSYIGRPAAARLYQGRSGNVAESFHQPCLQNLQSIVTLSNENNCNSNDTDHDTRAVRPRRRIRDVLQSALSSISKGVSLTRKNIRFVVALTITTTILSGSSRFMKIEPCAASAPVMAIPKAEGRDPITEALEVHQRKKAAAAQKELNEMAATARKIEAEQGEMARIKYENEYKEEQELVE